jgi:hypothetical protein
MTFSREATASGEAVGFRLTVDSEDQTCRGGAWKSRSPGAAQGWSVEEWSTSSHKFTSFRLARKQE